MWMHIILLKCVVIKLFSNFHMHVVWVSRLAEAFSRAGKPATQQQGIFINIFSVGEQASGGAAKRQFPRAGRRAVISEMGKTATAGSVYPSSSIFARHLQTTNTLCTRGKEAVPYIKREPWNCWCVLPLWPRPHEKKIFSFPGWKLNFHYYSAGWKAARRARGSDKTLPRSRLARSAKSCSVVVNNLIYIAQPCAN